MEVFKKQEGYTLLLTLVIVVLLFLITASFAVASMNQNKQLIKTDNSFVAVSLAEMGTEYVQDNVKIIIQNEQTIYENCISNTSNNTTTCYDTSLQNIKTAINNLAGEYEIDSEKNIYSVSTIIPSVTASQFSINIAGKTTDSTKTITVGFNIKPEVLSEIVYNDIDDDPITVTGPSLIDPSILQCIENAVCKAKLEQEGFVIYPEQVSVGNSFNTVSGSTYIFKEGAIFGQLKDDQKVSGVNIYTPESFTLDFTKFLAVENSVIEGGNITISHNGSSINHYMFKGSKLIANTLSITGNNVRIPFTSSNICIKNGSDAFLSAMSSDASVNIYFQINANNTESHTRHTYTVGKGANAQIVEGAHIYKKHPNNFAQTCRVDSFTFPEVVIEPEPPIEDISYN